MTKGVVGRAILATILCTAGALAQTGQYGNGQDDTQGGPKPPVAGGSPAVTLMPRIITFPPIPAGSISSTQTITVTNSGTAPLHISNVQVAAGTLPGFASISSCALPVAPGGSCSIGVTFYPSTVESRTAQLLITDDAPDSPQSVPLSGTAMVPYTISANGPASATVAAGGSTEFNVQITPVTGFIGSVQVQCLGAPRGTSCTPVPNTVALSSRDLSDDVVQIKVTAGGAGGTGVTAAGTYTLTIAANWGLVSEKLPLTIIVQ